MAAFFDGTRPGKTVTHGKSTFDLPILYFRDDMFALFFTCDLQKARALMPSDKLHPVAVSGRRATLAVVAFNYIDTSIGPYGEVGVIVPAVYGTKPAPMLVPGVIESKYPGFGALVMHLPVTKMTARDAGRGEWGYTKFVADMHFTNTPEYQEIRMFEQKQHIMTMRVMRQGICLRDRKPIITLSVKNGQLIKTTIPQKGTCRTSLRPKDSFLELGDHEMAQSIRDLEISSRPLQSRYYVERSGILPSGEVLETGVRPLDGIKGKDRKGKHEVVYTKETK